MAGLPDDLVRSLLQAMVESEDDDDSADEAFTDAFAAVRGRLPSGMGSDQVLEELASRGLIEVRREPVSEVGNARPVGKTIVIVRVTDEGRGFLG
jgi:hypothetical protein